MKHPLRRLPTGGRTLAAGALAVAALLGSAVAPSAAAPSGAERAAAEKRSGTRVVPRLPAPSGPHDVGRVDLHLVDRSRPDPWLTDVPYREMMVSVFYPARRADRHPVAPLLRSREAAVFEEMMGPALGLPEGSSVNWAEVRTHAHELAPVDTRQGGLPVVLYSPKHYEVRSYGLPLAEDLASRGYVVVTVGNTHESIVTEFPGGRVERVKPEASPPAEGGEEEWRRFYRRTISTRVADSRFVLDQLAALDAGRNPDAGGRSLPDGLSGALDMSRVGMTGLVGGGLTSLQTMHEDARVDAAAAVSDAISPQDAPWAPVVTEGTGKPFLLMSSTDEQPDGANNHLNDQDWNAFWPKLRGWRLNVELTGSTWNSFSVYQGALPDVERQLGLPSTYFDNIIGSVDPARSLAAQHAYLAAFFDRHLRDEDSPLLHRESPAHPDMKIVG